MALTLHSRGKFDLNFISILCHELSKPFSSKLHPHLFTNEINKSLVVDFYDSGHKILEKARTTKYTQKDFEAHMKLFTVEKEKKLLIHSLGDLEDVLYYAIFCQDKSSMNLLEQLLIALLGHRFPEVREKAVAYLNTIYDGTDWQLRGPYKSRIACVGNQFKLEYLIESDKDDCNIAFMLNASPFDGSNEESLISWHQPKVIPFTDEKNNPTNFVIVSVDFGFFPRAGFYDWKIIKFQRGGKIASVYTANLRDAEIPTRSTLNLNELSDNSSSAQDTKEQDFMRTKVIHGRFIVYPKYTRDLEIHEIYAHCPSGVPGEFNKGSFAKIRDMIPEYAKAGINMLYMMGVLETEGGKVDEDQKLKKKALKKKTFNPLAITCRKTVNSALGGPEEFKKLIKVCKEKKVRTMVDCLSRVNSSHPNKKYKRYFLQQVDEEGKLVYCYGGEGLTANYEDTFYLNFR